MKTVIKYAILSLFIFLSVFYILILSNDIFYTLYTNLLHSGRRFSGEDRVTIIFDVVFYVILPLSVLISFVVTFIIYYVKKRFMKNDD